jgi:hypothetical protein
MVGTEKVWCSKKCSKFLWLLSAVMAMYEEIKTVVRTDHGDSDNFAVMVGLHQGSVLCPYFS